MSWVTVVWSMMWAACVTLALIHGLVWLKRRSAVEYLLFAITAAATALLAVGELRMMMAGSPGEYARAVMWSHVPACVLIVALVGFVRRYLGAGSVRLAWVVCVLRVVSLVLNFATGENLNFTKVIALEPVPFLGDMVSTGVGDRNPMMLVGQASLLLLMVFVTGATVSVWRRGQRRQATVVGGGILLLVFLGGLQAALALWGVTSQPVMASVFYLGLVVAMASELSRGITETRRAQDETARLRVELAHVGRVSIVGQLGSALAHELNQPLGAILRNVEAAEIYLDREIPDLDEIRAIIGDIREDYQQAGAVIDRMRRMLQRLPLETEAVSIDELMSGVNALIRADATRRDIEVTFVLERELPLVAADRVHLQQVLLNLILNAMDAVDSGEPARRRVEVSATAGREGVTIAVKDHGTGFEPTLLEEIFQPFFTTKPQGMGMGLAISTTIVKAHGGELLAENHEAGGAIFRFQLRRFET